MIPDIDYHVLIIRIHANSKLIASEAYAIQYNPYHFVTSFVM